MSDTDTDGAAAPSGRSNSSKARLHVFTKRSRGASNDESRYSSTDEMRTPEGAKRRQLPTNTSTTARRLRMGRRSRNLGAAMVRIFTPQSKSRESRNDSPPTEGGAQLSTSQPQSQVTHESRNDSPPTEEEADGEEVSPAAESDGEDEVPSDINRIADAMDTSFISAGSMGSSPEVDDAAGLGTGGAEANNNNAAVSARAARATRTTMKSGDKVFVRRDYGQKKFKWYRGIVETTNVQENENCYPLSIRVSDDAYSGPDDLIVVTSDMKNHWQEMKKGYENLSNNEITKMKAMNQRPKGETPPPLAQAVQKAEAELKESDPFGLQLLDGDGDEQPDFRSFILEYSQRPTVRQAIKMATGRDKIMVDLVIAHWLAQMLGVDAQFPKTEESELN